MGIQLQPQRLLSRVLRFNTANGVSADNLLNNQGNLSVLNHPRRILDNSGNIIQQPTPNGLINRIWNPNGGLLNWAGNLIKGIQFSFNAAMGWLEGRIESLKNFNWNATDKDIERLAKSQNQAIAAAWGGLIGQGLGYVAGIAVGVGVGVVCPVIGGGALARAIASAVSLEAIEELGQNLGQVIVQTIGALANSLLLNGYKSYRNFLRRADRDTLKQIYNDDTITFIKNEWGQEGEPDLSFNAVMDRQVDKIKDRNVKVFVEEALEEGWDSFIDSTFIIANELDTAFQQNRVANQQNTERSVQIDLEDQNSEETLVFSNVPERELMSQVQATINNHRLIRNRDVGAIVGEPLSDYYLRALPFTRKLDIEFRDKERPPWIDVQTGRIKRVRVSIPDVKAGITWREVKKAAKSYRWGKFRATAKLNNGRQMAVYGATAAEAENKLKELIDLSTAQIQTLTIAEEVERPAKINKRPTMVYPAFATLLFRKNSTTGQGRTMVSSNTYEEKATRVPLYVETEPDEAKDWNRF